jgi:hypothetical protein
VLEPPIQLRLVTHTVREWFSDWSGTPRGRVRRSDMKMPHKKHVRSADLAQ